jgi:2-oxo-4-hydroxy-4-carboxy-5-ureidoimidazoline decarboxylase
MSVGALLDAASPSEARAMLLRCCGASRWVDGMLEHRPFGDDPNLHRVADAVWQTMRRVDVLEALAAHPEIGTDLEALRRKFQHTAAWSGQEQASVAGADETILRALRDGNVRYRERFGHIFVVCATGKSAEQMLQLLEARLGNDPETELGVAAAEQAKITHLRLEKLAKRTENDT